MIERLNTALQGRYRIERRLGEGGMATVFLAEDLKHRRLVAVKVLRPELAAVVGAERFLAEIETTANLQHPHILPLFDSGEADSFLFYVMPYVAGESLRELLDREKQLGVEDARALAGKVADALDYAHEKGLVHRDVKPANILLSERGEPLVADFGIALAVSQAGGGRMTETGLSLGTPHYMSPEQATGERDVDPRSDVYALGCVLYEMLAGEPPFAAPTSQAVLARILTQEPRRVTELRRTTPPHVDAVVAKALAKLPADRFASAAAFARALRDPSFRHETGAMAALVARREPAARRAWLAYAGAALLALVLLGVGAAAFFGGSGGRDGELGAVPASRFSVDMGAHPVRQSQLDLSPDGRMLVYAPDGDQPLYLRAMDELEARPIAGTDGARWPVFSPDGEWIAFMGVDGIRKIAVSGGAPLRITPRLEDRVGLHWGADGTLLYVQRDGIYRVPAQGGQSERILDGLPFSLRFARLLPRGETVIFSEMGDVGLAGVGEIRALDLATGTVTTLVEEGADARYVETGHLVYGHPRGALFAVPFDLDTRQVTGSPFPVLDPVRVIPGFWATAFAASRVGTVAYVRDQGAATRRALVMVDGAGVRQALPLSAEQVYAPRLSPDGRKLAYEGEAQQIYVYDLVVGSNTRLTSEGFNELPVWSPGGDSIVFASTRNETDGRDLFWVPANGEGQAELLWSEEGNQFPESWDGQGRRLVYTSVTQEGNHDLKLLDLRGDPESTPYLAADWDEARGRVSPDGRWLAYESDESGVDEVYVRAFPVPGAKRKVSEGGGHSTRWSRDGRELYYWRGDTLMAAAVRTEPSFEVLSRSARLEGAYDPEFDVRPDGGGFVLGEEVRADAGSAGEEERPPDLIVVVSWFEELMRLSGRLGRAR
ncbi:MAG TPA: protein kinase [Longimicrobiales bacterium]|nr:protein kinase [Longimicrobiales bacterium]